MIACGAQHRHRSEACPLPRCIYMMCMHGWVGGLEKLQQCKTHGDAQLGQAADPHSRLTRLRIAAALHTPPQHAPHAHFTQRLAGYFCPTVVKRYLHPSHCHHRLVACVCV